MTSKTSADIHDLHVAPVSNNDQQEECNQIMHVITSNYLLVHLVANLNRKSALDKNLYKKCCKFWGKDFIDSIINLPGVELAFPECLTTIKILIAHIPKEDRKHLEKELQTIREFVLVEELVK